MVGLAIEDNPYLELCTIDLDRPGPHYSVDTVHLKRSQSAVSAEACFFIIGSDSLLNLPAWHNPNKLITLCRLAIVHRAGYQPNIDDLEQHIPGLSTRLDWVSISRTLDFASSAIRKRLLAGQSIRYQVPDCVSAYIKQYQLYQQ